MGAGVDRKNETPPFCLSPSRRALNMQKATCEKKCCILLVAASNRKMAAEQSKAARSESEKRSSQQEAGKINRGSSRGERETERERARLSLFLRLLQRPFCLSSVSRRLALLSSFASHSLA